MRLANFRVSAAEHKKRQQMHLKKGAMFKESIDSLTVIDWDNMYRMRVFAEYPHNLLLASDPIFSTIPFGPVGTLQSSGCVAFVSGYIVEHYVNRRIEMRSWTEKVLDKGYRSWYFEKFPKVSFSTSKIDLAEAKKKLGSIEPKVLKCESAEDLIKVAGKVIGIGGSMFLIDNVIAELSKGKVSGDMSDILEKTRISDVSEVVKNLADGYMVPIRVKNSIYHADQSRTGGHYVILIGIEDGEAHILDSSIGFNKLPLKRLLEAAVADGDLIACWNLSCI